MSTIKIKRSGTSSQTPSTLEHGELALNYADGKLFYKDATNAIAEIGAGGGSGGLDSAAIGGVEVFSYKTRLITNEDRFAIGQNANINNNGEGNIAIGFNADANGGEGAISLGKSTSAGGYQGIAIGVEAKADENYSISMGVRAGANGGTESGILIGYQCGLYMSNSPSEEGNVFLGGGAGAHSSLLQAANFFNRTVAIGYSAATKTTGETADAIAIGYRAGQQEMGSNSINIGRDAGRINAGDNSITINATGLEVNNTAQYAIDIRTSDSGSVTYATDSDWVFGAAVTAPEFKFSDGTSMTTAPSGGGAGGGLDSAGVQLLIDDDLTGSGLNSVAIGNGATSVGAFNVSVGLNASAPGQESISIGRNTIGFGNNSVAIGPAAKSYNGSVTIGHDAHAGENGIDTVVIGNGAGGDNTGIRSVAIGFQSGGHTHGAYSPKHETTHIGGYAGRNDPQAYSTGIGAFAGGTTQGTEAVAVGYYAGNDTQGANAVAIGSWTAQTSQPANSIAISAIGNTPTGTAPPDGQYGIKIQTSDSGSVTYSTDSDWVFGASVNVDGGINASGDITAFSTSVSSDPRLKTDIVKIDNAVEKVQMLNGVSWDWIRGGKSAGVLSTDVAAVLPEAVTTGKIFGEDTEYDKVNYNALIGLLVEAVKELQEEVNELKNKG